VNISSKILIIDDEEDLAHLTRKRLVAKGYDVRWLSAGQRALETVQDMIPDLILLDVWLPDVSGFDVFKKIRAAENFNKIPILFFSADLSHENFCLEELKAEGFVRKPYQPFEMIDSIESALRLRRKLK
jgi:DNA-binding response OmpR family regulator